MPARSERAIVVKIGGSTLGGQDSSLADCARLQAEGRAVVLVHGGAARVSAWEERLGVESEFVGGLRKTTAASREVVVTVLAGLVNTELVQQLTALGARAMGVSGADAGLLRSPLSKRGLGYVGEAPVCDGEPLRALLAAGLLPVVAPIGLTPDGTTLININADAAAGAVAVALEAERAIFLTDVAGVLDAEGAVLERLDGVDLAALRAAGTIGGGMLPKVEAGRAAAAAGVVVQIVDGRRQGAVLTALQGLTGTRVE